MLSAYNYGNLTDEYNQMMQGNLQQGGGGWDQWIDIWNRPDPNGFWGWDSFNNRLNPWGQQTTNQWSGLPGGVGQDMGQNVDPGLARRLGILGRGILSIQ